ncbi:hypothetical protein LSAT2_018920 [Lamellibrachia satsuma]|nr:hypothetical protein LSAT2_018920 [Lamellibrachia satsuma]
MTTTVTEWSLALLAVFSLCSIAASLDEESKSIHTTRTVHTSILSDTTRSALKVVTSDATSAVKVVTFDVISAIKPLVPKRDDSRSNSHTTAETNTTPGIPNNAAVLQRWYDKEGKRCSQVIIISAVCLLGITLLAIGGFVLLWFPAWAKLWLRIKTAKVNPMNVAVDDIAKPSDLWTVPVSRSLHYRVCTTAWTPGCATTTVMEWTVRLLASFSLYIIAASLEEGEFIYTSEMRIVDRSFQPEFGDSTSQEYKALKDEMNVKILRLYGDQLGANELKRVADMTFSNGSILVRYKLVLAKNVSIKTLANLLKKASKRNSFGFHINTSSVKVAQTPVENLTLSDDLITFPPTTTPTTTVITFDVTSATHRTDHRPSSPATAEPTTTSAEPTSTPAEPTTTPAETTSSVDIGCTKLGCLNDGKCITQGNASWCMCTTWYSGRYCDIGHLLPGRYRHGRRIYRILVVVTGCIIGLTLSATGVLFVIKYRVWSQVYERTWRITTTKVHPTHDNVDNVHPTHDNVDNVAKPADSLATIQTV